jgi:hypothetical protein
VLHSRKSTKQTVDGADDVKSSPRVSMALGEVVIYFIHEINSQINRYISIY